jgi:hypothetical protein
MPKTFLEDEMKGEISRDGILKIERKKEEVFETGRCPFYKEEAHGMNCGDWCILFGEPYARLAENSVRTKKMICLELCHRALMFDKLVDNRS